MSVNIHKRRQGMTEHAWSEKEVVAGPWLRSCGAHVRRNVKKMPYQTKDGLYEPSPADGQRRSPPRTRERAERGKIVRHMPFSREMWNVKTQICSLLRVSHWGGDTITETQTRLRRKAGSQNERYGSVVPVALSNMGWITVDTGFKSREGKLNRTERQSNAVLPKYFCSIKRSGNRCGRRQRAINR
jgi:hypothetical protein